MLKAWGTKWTYALETFDSFKASAPGRADCGNLGVFSLGADTTWEAVEAVVLTFGIMPRKDWRTIKARQEKRLGV